MLKGNCGWSDTHIGRVARSSDLPCPHDDLIASLKMEMKEWSAYQ